MFKTFINDKKTIDIIDWLLFHPYGEYTAELIQEETNIHNTEDFIKRLHLLYSMDFCTVDANETYGELFVKFNPKSSLSKNFMEINGYIEDFATKNHEFDFVYTPLTEFDRLTDKILSEDFDPQELIFLCQNYIDLENSESSTGKQLFKEIKSLNDQGLLDDFIKFLYKLV